MNVLANTSFQNKRVTKIKVEYSDTEISHAADVYIVTSLAS